MLDRVTVNPLAILDGGVERYDQAVADGARTLPSHGSREVAFGIEAECVPIRDVQAFWSRIAVEQPYYTGFPPWVDTRKFTNQLSRPVERDGALQALIVDLQSGEMNDIDFWWIHPPDTFYHRRAFEDDISRSSRAPAPSTQIDFLLQISRVTEAVGVGLAFGRTLAVEKNAGFLSFAFRWRGLRGRTLSAWVDPSALRIPPERAQRDEVVSTCQVPLITPTAHIPAYVDAVLAPLFGAFGRNPVPTRIVDEIAHKLLQRAFG